MVGVMTRRMGVSDLDTVINSAAAATGYSLFRKRAYKYNLRTPPVNRDVAIYSTLSPEDVPAPYYVLIIGV